jgi:hypothetical protein
VSPQAQKKSNKKKKVEKFSENKMNKKSNFPLTSMTNENENHEFLLIFNFPMQRSFFFTFFLEIVTDFSV